MQIYIIDDYEDTLGPDDALHQPEGSVVQHDAEIECTAL